MLSETYRPLFTSLTPPEVSLVWSAITNMWHLPNRVSPPADPDSLFETCRNAGLDHASVVLSLAGRNGPARSVIEKLIGKPIQHWAESVEAAKAEVSIQLAEAKKQGAEKLLRHRMMARAADTRIVMSVAPQPYREGSMMHHYYQRWRVGDTVEACKQRGLPRWSVSRDIERGHVKVR